MFPSVSQLERRVAARIGGSLLVCAIAVTFGTLLIPILGLAYVVGWVIVEPLRTIMRERKGA